MELVKKVAGAVNRLLVRIGELIGRVVNPVVLGVLYIIVIGPVSFALRLRGFDPLRLRQKAAASCFVDSAQGNDTIPACRRQF